MFNDKAELLHLLQTARLLADGVWCPFQPRECRMIRSDSELSPKQVLLKVSEEMDNSQQFFTGDTTVSFSLIQ